MAARDRRNDGSLPDSDGTFDRYRWTDAAMIPKLSPLDRLSDVWRNQRPGFAHPGAVQWRSAFCFAKQDSAAKPASFVAADRRGATRVLLADRVTDRQAFCGAAVERLLSGVAMSAV